MFQITNEMYDEWAQDELSAENFARACFHVESSALAMCAYADNRMSADGRDRYIDALRELRSLLANCCATQHAADDEHQRCCNERAELLARSFASQIELHAPINDVDKLLNVDD